ncbi:hypothetical protein [Carboxylicivirga linearis]|uniref:Uncharacterized protein n=1 Tax=Carboxylicivirga linearis TaxID=1628157 RepID=A0ABS5JRC0_9BACT|nr:hypothetical protein [Carboxylicivirga linearis]MBS2097380.1 hypothetical protein [Carboxylicivirga linearis]
MTNNTNNKYRHIESFEDFEAEKMKLYYQVKFSEKKLQLKYLELTMLLSPAKLIPLLVSEWLSPIMAFIKNFIGQFFHRKRTTESDIKEDE